MENANPKPVMIRKVWANNIDSEFHLISQIISSFPIISMDSEFPGVIFHSNVDHTKPYNLNPLETYRMMKLNVDRLNLIQVGLTFSDAAGNLPDLGTGNRYIWEFNFCDFDVARDPHAPDSTALLRSQGIDFARNAAQGADSARFAQLMISSGLIFNKSVDWVTFHGSSDFAYLMKILTHKALPNRLDEFLWKMKMLFGRVYDAKHMIGFCPSLYGGLDRVAKTLNLNREIGKSHQSGSDSLLTLRVFQKIRDTYLMEGQHRRHVGVLFGLELKVVYPSVVARRLCPPARVVVRRLYHPRRVVACHVMPMNSLRLMPRCGYIQ